MHVFVYEFVTGGGFLGENLAAIPSPSLVSEGAAMAAALARDFAAIPGCQTSILSDARLFDTLARQQLPATIRVHQVSTPTDHDDRCQSLAAKATWTIVIAPEIGGHLEQRVAALRRAGAKILGPGTFTLGWASHKERTATYLSERGIPCPHGFVATGADLANKDTCMALCGEPCVVKPVDGAGSCGVRLAENLQQMTTEMELDLTQHYRVERYVPGRAASVAVLLGPGGPVVLQPCWQHLSSDGYFAYEGGAVMGIGTEQHWANRARQLGLAVAQTCPDDIGYIGIDCVLGKSAVDSDWVIEVNPRLTSSYLGLRQATGVNLAQAMLDVAMGKRVTPTWNNCSTPFEIVGL